MTRIASDSPYLCGSPEPFASTRGASAEMLASGLSSTDAANWDALLEELLRWRQQGIELFVADDNPTPEVLDTALDFIQDYRRVQRTPSSAIPSGSGRISFEWRSGTERKPVIESLEFTGAGQAEYVRIVGENVVELERWFRSPTTRRTRGLAR